MPLIPLADFGHLRPPNVNEIKKMRLQLKAFLPQMDWCRQCRADAVGLLDEEEDKYCCSAWEVTGKVRR